MKKCLFNKCDGTGEIWWERPTDKPNVTTVGCTLCKCNPDYKEDKLLGMLKAEGEDAVRGFLNGLGKIELEDVKREVSPTNKNNERNRTIAGIIRALKTLRRNKNEIR